MRWIYSQDIAEWVTGKRPLNLAEHVNNVERDEAGFEEDTFGQWVIYPENYDQTAKLMREPDSNVSKGGI